METVAHESLESRADALFASTPEARHNPYSLYRDLREAGPIHAFGPRVIITEYADIKAVLSDDDQYSHGALARGTWAAHQRASFTDEDRLILEEVSAFEHLYVSRSDGDAHHRLRSIAHRAFTPRRIMELGDAAQRYLDELLQPLVEQDPAEFADLAYRLPLMIIGDLLGVPNADQDLIHDWTDALARNQFSTNPTLLHEAHDAMTSLRGYVESMIEDHRSANAVPELVATFLSAEEDDRLSPEELTAMVAVLLFAGHETTTNLLTNGVLELLRHRDQWDALCRDPELAPGAVEEVLRYVSPVQFASRLPIVDVEIAGMSIPAGQSVFPMTAGANRDPAVFEDPDIFDIRRPNSARHLSFGFGGHFCIGNALARLEGTVVFRTLSQRYPDMELATDHFEWEGSSIFRKLTSLPVHF